MLKPSSSWRDAAHSGTGQCQLRRRLNPAQHCALGADDPVATRRFGTVQRGVDAA
ncbi:MAG: hypothetical protein HC788_14790 [Sphingopyxis sp.]|nr:hypothetical protein [Sphingopyxis sp.]